MAQNVLGFVSQPQLDVALFATYRRYGGIAEKIPYNKLRLRAL
jgi:hypothetical protein